MEDLEEAVNRAREAVSATSDDHPDRAAMLDHLVIMLGYRYERIRKMEDLEEAMEQARKAVVIAPEHHPDHVNELNKAKVFILSSKAHLQTEMFSKHLL